MIELSFCHPLDLLISELTILKEAKPPELQNLEQHTKEVTAEFNELESIIVED